MEKKNLKRKSLDTQKASPINNTTNNNNSDKINENTNKNSNINKNKKKQRKSLENENSKVENIVNNQNDQDKVVRVYADGIYDLFHFGHARSLQQAKQLFKNTYLIVGVCNDEITHRLKGKTVMNGEERAESLRHCRWVDEVVENAPWIVTQEFIDEHNIDYVSHGEDLCLDKDGNDIYQFVKDQGKFKTIKRTDGISTSDIILRIVKDYDSYVMRNLSRGYTGKQMNVGLIKETSLQLEEKYNQIKSKVKLLSNQTEQNILSFLQRFSKKLPKNWEKMIQQSPTSGSDTSSSNGDEDDILEDDTDDVADSNISSPPQNDPLSPTLFSIASQNLENNNSNSNSNKNSKKKTTTTTTTSKPKTATV
ncbi:hypothetical protein DICPUDRAFT_99357 [Dictyostelium purpureum]|uniref:choline-phosphate cytidylyltransferase n=1 Tax=Dictyostelium purpureum TaxID=5786 RepID=F0ZYG5_DICPU|nr:uncharacterized protein DICPUDRAFT_99357 [Dictyostelium purpureum]EGC31017.1 hypothetical protein DICPUDRAFT_99357 [Dictyostelium purpureum]|eukprot:XP_003292455.1 hypothetical protein DICPUDRAFT_99357 [Dictyostelium purpureum]